MRLLRQAAAGFWKQAMMVAFRNWARNEPGNLTGVPFYREIDDICVAYAPRPPRAKDWVTCAGDGHPLCDGCAHRDTRPHTTGGDAL